MPEVVANGVSLHYEEQGEGSAILCIHGMGSAAPLWGDAIPELARRGRTIAYDRRGCFRSERPEPYTTSVRQQADDAAALIEALGAAPAVVIGRSYGGETALDLALRHPSCVRALAVLEGTPAWLDDDGMRWWEEVKAKLLAVADRDIGAVAEALFDNVAGEGVWDGLPDPARDILAGNGAAIVAEARGGELDATLDELATIAHPTLLVVGENSLPGVPESSELLARAIPSARVTTVTGGHLVNPAHPVVLDFVDEVLAAP